MSELLVLELELLTMLHIIFNGDQFHIASKASYILLQYTGCLYFNQKNYSFYF